LDLGLVCSGHGIGAVRVECCEYFEVFVVVGEETVSIGKDEETGEGRR
jgi:hypothetical protein